MFLAYLLKLRKARPFFNSRDVVKLTTLKAATMVPSSKNHTLVAFIDKTQTVGKSLCE